MVDRWSVLALAAVAALLLWMTISGVGSPDIFWQTSSIVVVIGGAVLTALVASPTIRPRTVATLIRRAMAPRNDSASATIITLLALADMARRDGLLALEKPVQGLKDGFLKRAMLMAIDGTDPRMVESIMQAELESIDLRHAYGKGWLESLGRLAPSFGMIGTLIGLVMMLSRMAEPKSIGPGMAVALLTTLYGLVVANVFCYPLARRLGQHSSEELLIKTIMLKGVLAIQSGDSPRMVAEKLRAYLPEDAKDRDFGAASILTPRRYEEVLRTTEADVPVEIEGDVEAETVDSKASVDSVEPSGTRRKRRALVDAA